ncbi:unnamed protein product [Closterium sp. NIES-65]|nr:unnamed protein product [Closterium sp. NIES-65]
MFFSLPPIAVQSPFPTPTLIRCASFSIPHSSFSLMRYCSIHPFLSCPPLQGGPIFPLLLSPVVTLSQSRSHPTAPLNHHPFPSFFSLPPITAQSPFPTPTLIRCASFPIPLSSFSLMRYCSIHPFLSCPPLQGGPIFPLLLSPLVTLSQSRSHPTAPLNQHPFPSFFSLPPFAGQSPFPSPTLIRCASVPIPLSSFPPHQSRESHLLSPPLTPCDTVPIPLSSYCTLAPPSLPLFLLPTSLRRAVPFPYSNAHPSVLGTDVEDAAVFVLEEDMLPIPEEDEGEEVEEDDAEALDDQIQPSSTPARVGATQDEARVHGLDEAEHVAVTEEHAEVPVGAPQDEGDTVGVGGADSTAGEAVHEESSPARVDTSQDEACVHGLDEAAHVAVPEKHAAVPVGAPHDDRDTVGVGGADSTAGEAVHEESTPAR